MRLLTFNSCAVEVERSDFLFLIERKSRVVRCAPLPFSDTSNKWRDPVLLISSLSLLTGFQVPSDSLAGSFKPPPSFRLPYVKSCRSSSKRSIAICSSRPPPSPFQLIAANRSPLRPLETLNYFQAGIPSIRDPFSFIQEDTGIHLILVSSIDFTQSSIPLDALKCTVFSSSLGYWLMEQD
jgi:hypothetical protein